MGSPGPGPQLHIPLPIFQQIRTSRSDMEVVWEIGIPVGPGSLELFAWWFSKESIGNLRHRKFPMWQRHDRNLCNDYWIMSQLPHSGCESMALWLPQNHRMEDLNISGTLTTEKLPRAETTCFFFKPISWVRGKKLYKGALTGEPQKIDWFNSLTSHQS